MSGLLTNILFNLNRLANKGKPIRLRDYLKCKKYQILLTICLAAQAAYFNNIYIDIAKKMYSIEFAIPVSYWLLGLFSNSVMAKIFDWGEKKLNGNGK